MSRAETVDIEALARAAEATADGLPAPRLTRTRKLFGFLRRCRRELFSDDFQAELESMYRDSGAGRDPVPPALLSMATLLQARSPVPPENSNRLIWAPMSSSTRRHAIAANCVTNARSPRGAMVAR